LACHGGHEVFIKASTYPDEHKKHSSAELLDLYDVRPMVYHAPSFQCPFTPETNFNPDSPQSNSKSPKKRQRISSEQSEILEEVYKQKRSPGPNLRNQLATQLQMTPRRVQIWFQNKRAREKRSKESMSPFASSLFNLKVVKYCVHS